MPADEAIQWGLAGYAHVENLAVALVRRPGRALTQLKLIVYFGLGGYLPLDTVDVSVL
jgi:hypothetical protein